jgi:beta-phosphoglucomutase-like phosphatase (HAD superfamily)
MIKAAIFDLDGLLIDSEPLWQKAEIKVFNSIGVPLTKAVVAQTIGLRTDATVHYWHQRYAWTGPSEENVCKQIDDMVIALIEREGTSKEGVEEIIAICERLDVLLAIASSSSLPIINAAITKLKLDDKLKVVHSAESEVSGKPDPAVYFHKAEKNCVKT